MSPISESHTALSKTENGVFDVTPKTHWQKSAVERNALQSSLLRLPRELRDLIWTFTFTGTAKPACKVSRYSPFSVLTVCRQIYTEAISLAGPFLTWSFICLRDYESFFWDIIYSEGPKHKIRLVHSIQIGVDPSDLYMLAQIVDPGTDDDVDDETGEYRPTLRAFENLTHVDLLLSATGFFADSDNEDDEEAEEVEPTRYESEYIEESRVNFTKTMERKLPSVRVTYKDFDDSSAMKRFWTTQDPKELILRTSSECFLLCRLLGGMETGKTSEASQKQWRNPLPPAHRGVVFMTAGKVLGARYQECGGDWSCSIAELPRHSLADLDRVVRKPNWGSSRKIWNAS